MRQSKYIGAEAENPRPESQVRKGKVLCGIMWYYGYQNNQWNRGNHVSSTDTSTAGYSLLLLLLPTGKVFISLRHSVKACNNTAAENNRSTQSQSTMTTGDVMDTGMTTITRKLCYRKDDRAMRAI